MNIHESQILFLNNEKEKLNKMISSNWAIYTYAYCFDKSAEPQLIAGPFVGDDITQNGAAAEVAEMVAYFHFPIVVDPKLAKFGLEPTAAISDGKKISIYAVPVFRPDIYDPSPILRPILGVVCFASNLSTEQLIQNKDLHPFAERFVGKGELADILKTLFSFTMLTWEDIRENVLNRLGRERFEPDFLREVSIADTKWLEFKPGCLARETDLRQLIGFLERSFVPDKKDRWIIPIQLPEINSSEDIKEYINAGDFSGLYRKIDSLHDADLKDKRYREVAILCMERDDKFNSVIAAKKRQEAVGETPQAYTLLGYVYWWFEDIDKAIECTETALQLALELKNHKPDASYIYSIKNNLAYYYAEAGKETNKELAISYVEDNLANIPKEEEIYSRRLDTAGYVYLKFATKVEDVDKAIKNFMDALELEPQSKDTKEHLIEAFEKKKSLKSENNS